MQIQNVRLCQHTLEYVQGGEGLESQGVAVDNGVGSAGVGVHNKAWNRTTKELSTMYIYIYIWRERERERDHVVSWCYFLMKRKKVRCPFGVCETNNDCNVCCFEMQWPCVPVPHTQHARQQARICFSAAWVLCAWVRAWALAETILHCLVYDAMLSWVSKICGEVSVCSSIGSSSPVVCVAHHAKQEHGVSWACAWALSEWAHLDVVALTTALYCMVYGVWCVMWHVMKTNIVGLGLFVRWEVFVIEEHEECSVGVPSLCVACALSTQKSSTRGASTLLGDALARATARLGVFASITWSWFLAIYRQTYHESM